MSQKKLNKKERKSIIIENLKESIAKGGNGDVINKLKEILKNVENDTHTIDKRRGRKPKPKSEVENNNLNTN